MDLMDLLRSPTDPSVDGVAAAGSLGSRLLILAALLLMVWVGRRLSWPLARRLVRFSPYSTRERVKRPARQTTLQGLVADLLSFSVILLALLIGVVQLLAVDVDTLVWAIGLLSAGFGFAARPILSDILSGISFVFDDTFTVGEKVEFGEVEGVIEEVNLRTTHLRAPSGELCLVPNGEIRILRNFSRGIFSTADLTLKVAGEDLDRSLRLLEEMAPEVADALPDLIPPWRVISKSGALGKRMELTLLARTRFGTGAEMRPRLMSWVHQRFREAGIELEEIEKES